MMKSLPFIGISILRKRGKNVTSWSYTTALYDIVAHVIVHADTLKLTARKFREIKFILADKKSIIIDKLTVKNRVLKAGIEGCLIVDLSLRSLGPFALLFIHVIWNSSYLLQSSIFFWRPYTTSLSILLNNFTSSSSDVIFPMKASANRLLYRLFLRIAFPKIATNKCSILLCSFLLFKMSSVLITFHEYICGNGESVVSSPSLFAHGLDNRSPSVFFSTSFCPETQHRFILSLRS